MREALELIGSADSAERMSDFFKGRMVQSGSSTHIAFPLDEPKNGGGPFVVEWDGNPKDGGATVRGEDPSVVRAATVCTNHYIKRRPGEIDPSKNSQIRFQRLVELLNKSRVSGSVVTIKKATAIMDSVALGGRTTTYLAWIAIPSDRKIVFAVSPGLGVPATRGKWIELEWNEIFGVL
jgi:hypothetical protein